MGLLEAARRQRLSEFLELVPAALLLLDAGGRVAQANARARALLGQETEALPGRRLEDLFPGQAAAVQRLAQAGPGEETGAATLEVAVPGAAGRWLALSLGSTTSAGRIALLSDLTALKTRFADRTRAVLDSVLVGIVTVGPEGIRWMNRSARRMFGGDLPDFVGQPLDVVAPPGIAHPFREAQVHAALEEGRPQAFECRVTARDGRDFWVVGNVVRTGRADGDGELTYALLDIDRRRRAEERMAEAQASLQRLIEAAPLAIMLRDARELRVLQVNPAAAALIGLPVETLRGSTVEEIFAPRIATALRADMQAALASPEVTQREYRLEGEDGQPVVLDARYLPLARPGEPPDQLLLVAADVSEQRAAQQARLEAALAQRDLLVREVHHRIKNNLQGVAGLLQQIAAGKPEVAAAIGEVVGQVQAIAQVYGLQVGAVGALRLQAVLEAITGSVGRTFDRPIALELPDEGARDWLLPEAEAIPVALTVNELLTNAIKHSPAGEAVRCRLLCDAAEVRIEVLNRGRLPPGFSLERLPGRVSGLGLVRALLPRRHAQLTLRQQGEAVQALVRLQPPSVLRAPQEEAASGEAPPLAPE